MFTTSRPLATSKASARSDTPRRRPSALSTAVVSQMRSPAMDGDDQPRPGTGVFQSTLRDSLHSSGRPVSDAWPWPDGPRNCGHWAADAAVASSNATAMSNGLDKSQAPSSKFQRTPNLQVPSYPNSPEPVLKFGLEVGKLGVSWDLELGIWNLTHFTRKAPPPVPAGSCRRMRPPTPVADVLRPSLLRTALPATRRRDPRAARPKAAPAATGGIAVPPPK